MPEQFAADGVVLDIRPDTLDAYVAQENLVRHQYPRRVPFPPEAVWLDVGAHIGAFTCWAAQRCVSVHAYEPAPPNAALLYRNVRRNAPGRVVVHEAAIVGNADRTRTLYLNLKQNTGAHSLVVKRGRTPIEVEALHINRAWEKLHTMNPDCLAYWKLDCEGAEGEILPAFSYWETVAGFVMEYHFNALHDKHHIFYWHVIELLKAHFPYVQYLERPGGHWATLISATREPVCS